MAFAISINRSWSNSRLIVNAHTCHGFKRKLIQFPEWVPNCFFNNDIDNAL